VTTPYLRLLHCSDLHIAEDLADSRQSFFKGLSSADFDSLSALEAAANKRALGAEVPEPLPDSPVCMISGDLSAAGAVAEITNAVGFVRCKVYQTCNLGAGLEYGDTNVNMVLGNHDVWGGQSALLAWLGADEKRRRAAGLLGGFPRTARWVLGSNALDTVDVGSLRVRGYLLDSTRPGFLNVFARGRVPHRALEELERAVREDEESDASEGVSRVLRVAMLHHPLDGNERGFFKFLENRVQVLAMLEQLGFGLVLCGHEHKKGIVPIERPNGGILYQCVAGTASQVLRKRGRLENTFLVLDVFEGNQSRARCEIRVKEYTKSDHQGARFTARGREPMFPSVAII
jgi:hypothetical protein